MSARRSGSTAWFSVVRVLPCPTSDPSPMVIGTRDPGPRCPQPEAEDAHEVRLTGHEVPGAQVRAAVPSWFRRPYGPGWALVGDAGYLKDPCTAQDRKSTRLNSSHVEISYAVFCLKKKR